MAQFPSNVPTGYAGDATDFLKVKADKFGALRNQYSTISTSSGATAGTTYGMVPFNKGFRLSYATKYHVTDIDAGTAPAVTLNVGYLYSDTALTSDNNAFASAVTTGQTGGLVDFDEHAGLSWVAEGNGWITFEIGTAAQTGAAGTIKGQSEGCYDGLDASN